MKPQITLAIVIAFMSYGLCLSGQQKSGEQKNDALALINKVSDTYKAFESYYIEGTSIADQQHDESRELTEYPIIIAKAKPDKRRLETKDPFSGAAFVSDGTTAWSYMAMGHQFSKSPAAQAQKPKIQFLPKDYVERYANLAKEIHEARYVGNENLTFEGKQVDCAVLEFAEQPDEKKLTKNPEPVKHTIWVDKARYWVLQESWKEPPFDFMGITMRSSMKVVFKTIRVNEPVPDAVFTFTPPKNAIEVAEVTPPGGKSKKIIGKDVPELTLTAIDGTQVSMKALRGKTVLMYFWATWCVPCREASPIVKKEAERWKDKGLTVLAIDYGEEKNIVDGYLAKNHAPGTVLLDENRAMASSCGVQGIPGLLVVSKEGKIVYQEFGYSDDTESSLNAALKKQGFE
ncbi:MAG TPA: redoxin family protein [Candidatus Angelobacter sp.]|nr:redoxin family protein [Candidatus Angelobacter sp.]